MKKVLYFLFLGSFLFFSCAEEQNFDQFDDLSVTPTLATGIFYFESPEDVINQLPQGVFYNQTFTFEAFNEAFVSERVLDGTITYQLENTTSKELNLLVEFLDDADTVLDSESFTIDPQPAPLLERQVAYGNGDKDLDILRNTTRIRVTSENLGDNTSQSTANEPRIILRSSAAFRVRLQ
ncbi:hypothetical protein MTsPCn9_27400 [Croceitalea sp. MTPC9]|uniref:hypothetical protein n=1 Tax=unclassified Croceitalea TaxID=2632280 RepID=UPI002B3F76DA|nr:hypothetical protein MTsPCn6_22780 [Croceitalea sp. MTPC6]GMN17802.1 hypothetical protein MTsPCn9_27400 [Croceitalea sp. MTPC9]